MRPRPARVVGGRRSRLGRIGRAAWLVALPLVAVGMLKVFVADVYRVDSGSMEPTIRGPGPGGFEATGDGGEAVLVRYADAPRLRRHDLVVVLRAEEREPIVKRVVGLPGEELRIRDGDLVIDGRKLDPRAPRPPLIPIFDSLRHPLRKHFELEGEWDDTPGGAPGDASGAAEAPGIGGLAASGAPARACWRGGLNDDRLDSAGLIVRGREPVGDAALECAVRWLGTGGVLSLSLTEEGDVFELRLTPTATGTPAPAGSANGEASDDPADDPDGALLVRAELLRRGDETLGRLLAATSLEARRGEVQELRFANVDDVLSLDLGGARLFEVPYASNTPLVGAPDPRLRHRRPRACLGAVELAVAFERVRVLRDLHYTPFGDIGVLTPVNLAGDEYFCLGDSSSESVDGRTFGPVAASEVLGIPLAVVWPLDRARRLRPTVAPPPLAPGRPGAPGSESGKRAEPPAGTGVAGQGDDPGGPR